MSNKLLAIPLAIVFAVVAFALCTTVPTAPGPPPDPPDTNGTEGLSFMLPVEVLGEPGHIETFSMMVTNGSTADTLYLQVHNLSYEGKMSVRLNGGSWMGLTDSNVTYPFITERGFYGMGGIMNTLRLTVPTTSWTCVDGTNEFSFRFNDVDGKTIGFRVLSFQLRDGSTDLIHTNQFTYDDPSAWTPISADPADLNAGSNAWFTGAITEGGVSLNVFCTDCHARDGRDLKYFNYSDKSIIQRSVFHGLSLTTSSNIASYIRNLSVPYETNGRPWNPPYQPGPGMDAKPIRSWAAGAGLEWVLDTDTNTLAYIFPSGITTNHLNLATIVNAREIPLAMQFQDWNNWLPKVHPTNKYPVVYATNLFVSFYQTIRAGLVGKSNLAAATYFIGRDGAWDGYSGKTGIVKPDREDPAYDDWVLGERDKRHWRAVKIWEIMTEFAIEDYGDETSLFPAVPNGAALNERRWFDGEIFRLGPHVIGGDHDERFAAESTQWYHTQLVLNDGNRRNGSITPLDWGYQHALNVSAWNNPANMSLYGAEMLNIIKAIEVGFNGIPLTTTHSFNALKADTFRLQSGYQAGKYAAIPAQLRKAVCEAIIVRWLEQMESYTLADWTESKATLNNVEGRLDSHLTYFPTIGVDSSILDRITAVKATLFP